MSGPEVLGWTAGEAGRLLSKAGAELGPYETAVICPVAQLGAFRAR